MRVDRVGSKGTAERVSRFEARRARKLGYEHQLGELPMLHSIHQRIAKTHQPPAEAGQPEPEPRRPASEAQKREHPVAVAGRLWVRYALVVVIAWIGALKYSAYEAAAIHPLIANSPLMSWFYNILSVRALAATLGSLEIVAALLIALRVLSPRVSAIGSAMAILLSLAR